MDFIGMCIVIIFLCCGFACKLIWDSLLAVESSVFTFDRPISFFHLFGSEERTKFEPELDALAKQVIILFFHCVTWFVCFFLRLKSFRSWQKVVSICATLGEDPIIRYHRPLNDETGAPSNKSLPYKLAMTVQREVDNFCRVNPNFPVGYRYVPLCLFHSEQFKISHN